MPRVLILDPEKENTDYFQALFRKSKAEILITRDVQKALDVFWKPPFDLVIVNFFILIKMGSPSLRSLEKLMKMFVQFFFSKERNPTTHEYGQSHWY